MGSTGAPPAAWQGPGIEGSSNRSQSTYLRPLRVQTSGASSLVAGTDLVAVVPQMFADAMAARHGLQIWDLPKEAGYDVRMVWHRSVNDDPAQRWQIGRASCRERV